MPGDDHFDSVVLLVHADGANGSTTFTDKSAYAHAIGVGGHAQVSTAQSKFGGASALLDGNGDSLGLNGNNCFAIGTYDFTIEMWIHPLTVSNNKNIIDFRPSGTNGAYPVISFGATVIDYYVNNAAAIQANHGMTAGNWYHIAVSRVAGITRMFINGVQVGSNFTDNTNYLVGGSRPIIGMNGWNTSFDHYHGYIDEVRITRGVGRYAANFTPHVHPHPDFMTVGPSDPHFPNVVSLLHFNGPNGSQSILDTIAGRTWSALGNAQLNNTTAPKFGTANLWCDGSTDSIVSTHADYALGTGDFTIEGWILPTNGGGGNAYARLIQIGGNSVQGSLYIVRANTPNPLVLSVELYNTNFFNILAPSATINNGVWTHFAITRQAGVWRVFYNGFKVAETTFTGTGSNLNGTSIYLGGNASNTESFNGRYDDWRITKGVARYTADFTPPTAPYVDHAGTVEGVVRDASNALVSRVVRAYRRDTGALVANTMSDPADGAYRFGTPTFDEVTVVAFDSATTGTIYNDICERVIPAL